MKLLINNREKSYYSKIRENIYDLVTIDHIRKVFYVFNEVSYLDLDGYHYNGEDYEAEYLTNKTFNILIEGLKVSGYKDISNQPSIELNKSEVFKILNFEYDFNLLRDAILTGDLQTNNYFDYELIKKGFEKIFKKEVSISYFSMWCEMMSKALNEETCIVHNHSNKYINEIFSLVKCFSELSCVELLEDETKEFEFIQNSYVAIAHHCEKLLLIKK